MAEPVSHSSIIGGLIAVIAGLFSWMSRRQIDRVDKHDEIISDHGARIAGMEKDWIEAEHFEDTLNNINKTISSLDLTVRDFRRETKASFDTAHNRIDKLYEIKASEK